MNPHAAVDEDLTYSIIGAFFDVYNALGFGFLEHLYVTALERELRERGHEVARELSVSVMYKGEELGTQRLDMVVDGKVVIEVKSTFELHRSATRQLYNYLRATKLELGFLFYFGRKPEFYRVTCRHRRPSSGARDLEYISLPRSEQLNGDVPTDPLTRRESQRGCL
jgi:GxxExxY protein